jgi:hypothetical protein
MRRLSIGEVHERKITELGLDPGALDLTSIEAIAGALRRTANFLCPCSEATLVRGVVLPLRGLVEDLEAVKVLVKDTLEAIIAHGDILEHCDVEESIGHETSALLYAAPPAFVARQNGMVILLGIAPDQLSALPDDLEARIEYLKHLRRLSPAPGENLRSDMVQLGLIELSYADWLRMPPVETPAQQVSRLDRLLDAVQPSRDIPGLLLLDPERSVRYYRGRWVEPRSKSGRFVARRSQAYGADLWCYVQLRNGNPERLIDFPIAGSRWRGCDEAWHLQIAIDAKRGEPQRFRVRSGHGNTCVMEFFSPVPMWAQRRWDAVGEPVMGSGCLFAYRLAEAELAEELGFAREVLCLEELTGDAKQP